MDHDAEVASSVIRGEGQVTISKLCVQVKQP